MAAKLSGGGGGKYDIGTSADMNVTPLVDVMLVLLIIFMVTAPLATVSIRLDLPPPTPPAPGVIPPEPVYISIQETGSLFIADKQTTIENLVGDVDRAIGGANPREERIFVRAQAEVKYNQFMEVMNTLQENGYFKVGLLNEDIE